MDDGAPMVREIFAFLLVLQFVVDGAASACSRGEEKEVTDIGHAELVVRARVVDFRKVAEDSLTYGLIYVDVLETWRGEHRSQWELRWVNSVFGMPDGWGYGDDVVIAASDGLQALRPFAGVEAWPYGDRRSGVMQVLQAPCAPPFIFRTSPREDEISAWRDATDGLRRMMEQMPNERMRKRLDQMLGADPVKTYRRRIAALRACVEEDAETCRAVWKTN